MKKRLPDLHDTVKWKDTIVKRWMVWACEPDTVYYLIQGKYAPKWMLCADIQDSSNTVTFADKEKAVAYMESVVVRGQLPSDKCNAYEVCEVVPTYEEKSLWYETVKIYRKKIK